MRRIPALAAWLAFLAASVLGPASPAGAGGLVSITFDDASRSQHDEGLPIAREYDIPGTLYVISSKADEADNDPRSWGMSWSDIAEFRDAGWEIGSHTETHPHLTEVPQAQVIRELDVARARIKARLGVDPVSFAAPFGDYNADVLALVRQRYASNVTAWGGEERPNLPGQIDRYQILRRGVDVTVPPQTVCREIRQAADRGTWLILMFHTFEASDPQRFQIAPDAFREMMACAAAARDAGSVRVVTIEQGLQATVASN